PDLLRTERAASQRIHCFEGPRSYRELTVAELRGRALARLGDLQRAGLGPGDELVMPVASPLDFLEVFWACQLGGQVPMPLAPPSNQAATDKLRAILGERGGARLVMEPGEAERAGLGEFDPLWPLGDGVSGVPVERRPEDLAFVQYSSGSTRAPKGVLIRQGQALANLEMIRVGGAYTPEDATYSWMPLSHDMGLVGFHLAPLEIGMDQYLMPTSAFARAPLVWLSEVSERRATVLSSPNFGYRHVLRALARKGVPEGLDLSNVRLVMNGAEPIALELAQEFNATLAPHGLRPSAMFPVYGLAEATLAVTFPRVGSVIDGVTVDRSRLGPGDEVALAEDGLAVVGCGQPLKGLELRIAGDDGAALDEGRVGRVLMRGANVTEGYLDDPEATATARYGDGWFDTGDLGFLRSGELYLTGRSKELLIVDGQNFYPHDVERSLGEALELDLLRIAVAPVRAAGAAEQVAVFVQHRGPASDFQPTVAAVRGHLSRAFGIGVEWVVPVDQIPRTTSGKLQRGRLAGALLNGDYAAALADLGIEGPAPAPAPTRIDSPEGFEALLFGYCDDVLERRSFGPDDSLFDQGLSSIDLAEIHGRLEAEYPGAIEIRDFFDHPTVRELARLLVERTTTGGVHA
ncbi:MAG: non-ribosomal peptide synthetase, partial [Planctomycetota bacterium]